MELEDLVLSEQAILERIDEYALYCFYLGYATPIGKTIISPIRRKTDPDTVGSFVIFQPTRISTHFEFLWTDNGTGQRGNIFQMISAMYGGLSISAVYKLIDSDFELGFADGAPICHRIEASERPEISAPCEIKIRSREFRPCDLDYWNQWGVTKDILQMYNITSVDMFWLTKFQKHPKIIGKQLCFAYRIWSKYKLYRPLAPKKEKFRNDFTPIHVEGYCQLKYNSDTLIVTKSTKDIAMFRAIDDFDSISSRGENTPIPDTVFTHLRSRGYKRFIIWNDNDGKESGEKYYPYLERVHNPPGPKDPTDFYLMNGKSATRDLIYDLTGL